MLERLCILVSLACVLSLAAAAGASVLPRPRKSVDRGRSFPVTGPVSVVLSDTAGEVEHYAAARLATLLKARFGLDARVTHRVQRSAQFTVWLCTPQANERIASRASELGAAVTPSAPGPEGYRIRVRSGSGGVEAAVAGSDASGLLYGALSLPQLMRHEGGAVSIRCVDIDDSPAVPVRAIYVIPQRLGLGWGREAEETGVGGIATRDTYTYYLDWLAEHRINLVYYELAGHVRLPDGFADLVREAHRRGMRFFGGVRYVGSWRESSYICASDPAQVARVLSVYDRFLDAGCDGIAYLADDIAPRYLSGHCDRCRERFGGLAGEQAFLLRQIANRAVERGIAPGDIYFCPTHYSRYDGTHRDYFLAFARDELLRRIPFFMTFYDPAQIERFRSETGLQYLWWYNGPRSISYFHRGKAHYGAADAMYYPLMFGWHGLTWEWRNGFGLPNRKVAGTFADMHRYADVFWMCCGGGDTVNHAEYAHAMWGLYAWRPSAFGQEAAEQSVLARLMGPEAARALQQANDECFVAFTVVEPARAHPVARIEQAVADARRAISDARAHYDTFWAGSGHAEYADVAQGFVVNTFDRYERALGAVEDRARALAEEARRVEQIKSAALRDVSAPADWQMSADGAWNAETAETALVFSLPGRTPQPAPAAAGACLRVVLPRLDTYQIVFSVSDSYPQSGTPPHAWPGHIVKQVLVDDQVIWQDDVEGDETPEEIALQAARFQGEGGVTISLRAAVIRDVSNMGVTVTFQPIAIVPERLSVASAFVEIPHHSDLDPAGTMTILTRARFADDVDTKQFLFAKGTPFEYFCYLRQGRIVWGVYEGETERNVATEAIITPGSEHTLACVIGDERLSVVVDGRLTAEGPAPPDVPTRVVPFRIAGRGHGGDVFTGTIEEIAVYDRALSLEESSSAPDDGAVGRWQPGDLHETKSPGPVPDFSGRGRDGYLHRLWRWDDS
ncbi:MAG: hypothetical protein JSV65_10955 [Armatimonadota bacterium]|nr:MAG: hypothetical protein JSV65_10955 [Armatimonadota bacterium]